MLFASNRRTSSDAKAVMPPYPPFSRLWAKPCIGYANCEQHQRWYAESKAAVCRLWVAATGYCEPEAAASRLWTAINGYAETEAEICDHHYLFRTVHQENCTDWYILVSSLRLQWIVNQAWREPTEKNSNKTSLHRRFRLLSNLLNINRRKLEGTYGEFASTRRL